MDKPAKLPINLPTPVNELESCSNIKEYNTLDYEEKENYLMKLGEQKNKESLIIQAHQKDQLVNYFYQTEKNFEDFQSLSKGFKMCDTIDEIYEVILEIFDSNKFYIKTDKEKDKIILILKIYLLGGKMQEIQIELKKKESNTNVINIELCNKVNALEKQIEEMKKENLLFKETISNELEKINSLERVSKEMEKIKNLEKIIMEQKSEIQELKEWKARYDKEIQRTIKKKKDEEIMKKIDSKIIKEKKELDFLEERLKRNDPLLMKRTVIYKLLYRATKDGNNASSFHKKCDNISGTLTILKTNKGMRFGGYTEKTWDGNQVSKKDNQGIAFCYSLDLFKIYNNSDKAESSIRCYTDEGPNFYGGDCYMFYIYFPIDTNTSSSTVYKTSNTSYGKFEKDYEINNGESNFVMQELEVFQILFD